MSRQAELAERHNRLRIQLGHAATVKSLRMWKQINVQELDAGWDAIAPTMTALVTSAQVTAARQSAPYLNAIDDSYDRDHGDYTLVPEAFGGVTLEGREVGPAMFGAVTHTKQLIGKGKAPFQAFESGAAFLATVIKTSIADMGRAADRTLGTAKTYTMYVRVVNGNACSRCAILAGEVSSSRTAFLRHANCQCSQVPLGPDGHVPEGLFSSPEEYFESLSTAEQDRVFTKSGAWAIRHGASPIDVVNARRGAYGIGYSGHHNVLNPNSGNRLQPITIGRKADGTPLQVYATTEGTTIRGAFGRRQYNAGQEVIKGEGDRYRRTTRLRLMPEQIQKMAGDDTHRAAELLQRYGYLSEREAAAQGVSHIR